MAKTDAERAMEIYRNFTKQTDFVVQYLGVARHYEHHTRVEVPKLKHAPVNLGRQLEEYLRDTDFEAHRRQYLAEQESKKTKGGSSGAKMLGNSSSAASKSAFATNGAQTTTAKSTAVPKGPDSNLIDFFESIEQNQTPMAVQQPPRLQGLQGVQSQLGMPQYNGSFQVQPPGQYQSNGFAPQPTGFQPQFQNTNPFPQQVIGTFSPQQQSPPQPLQSSMTGAGFGGFTPQPQSSFQPSSLGTVSQTSVASFQAGTPTGFPSMFPTQQQTTNPFRASMFSQQTGAAQPNTLPFGSQQQPTGMSFSSSLQQQPTSIQSTNPFSQQSYTPPTAQPFASPAANPPFQSPPPQQQMPMITGTNPFQRNYMSPPQQQQQQQQQRPATAGGPLMPQATGTNPFRQGPFGGGTAGLGVNQTSIGGGLDHLQPISVFPQTQQSQWHA